MTFATVSILILGVLGASSAFYDASLARNKMMALCSAAYSTDPQACLSNSFSNAQIKRRYEVPCDDFDSDTCSGFTAVSQGDQAIILAFRGTTAFLQLVAEGGDSLFKKKVPSKIGGSVDEYFWNGFNTIWTSGMKDDFLALKNTYPGFKVYIAGHSLGGAMASITASTIIGLGYVPASNVYLYTLGQPRTGDTKYAQAFDALNLAAVYRITHAQDIVPHIPTEGLEDYIHHKNEVWYNNNMKINDPYVECDAEESKKCSDGNLLSLSINQHLHYFDMDISDFGKAGCIASFSQYYPQFKEEDFQKIPHDMPELKYQGHP